MRFTIRGNTALVKVPNPPRVGLRCGHSFQASSPRNLYKLQCPKRSWKRQFSSKFKLTRSCCVLITGVATSISFFQETTGYYFEVKIEEAVTGWMSQFTFLFLDLLRMWSLFLKQNLTLRKLPLLLYGSILNTKLMELPSPVRSANLRSHDWGNCSSQNKKKLVHHFPKHLPRSVIFGTPTAPEACPMA